MNDIDLITNWTDSENYIMCPYCHKEISEPEELNLEDDIVDTIECKSCLNSYNVYSYTQTLYMTKKLDKK